MKRSVETASTDIKQPAAEKKEKLVYPQFTDLESWHTFVVADLEFHCRDGVNLYANASHLTLIPYFRDMFIDCKLRANNGSKRMIIMLSDITSCIMEVILYHSYGFSEKAGEIICRLMKDERTIIINEMLTFFDKIIYNPLIKNVYNAIKLLDTCPAKILPILIKHSNYGKSPQFADGFENFENAFLTRMELLMKSKNVPVILETVATTELIQYYLSLHCTDKKIKLNMLLAMGANNLAKVLTKEHLSSYAVGGLIHFMQSNRIFDNPKLCEIFVGALVQNYVPGK